jgi:hypothetical protein
MTDPVKAKNRAMNIRCNRCGSIYVMHLCSADDETRWGLVKPWQS